MRWHMGLDTDIYRVNRKKAETGICIDSKGQEYIDYWTIQDDVKTICYQRKNYVLQYKLEELTAGHQCEYMELTKLKAYHLLHCMEQRNKGEDEYDRRRKRSFVQEFKQALHNFDWERDMMVWNWC